MAAKVRDSERRRDHKQAFASTMRLLPTDAERRLWSALRCRQIGGLRFRRKQPIGPYIVDFYCSVAKLIVELDGDHHGADETVAYDETRTRWLEANGYNVLRFPNGDAFKDPDRIVKAIVHHCEVHDIPLPGIRCANSDPPSRGG